MVRELLFNMNDKQLNPHFDKLVNGSSILFQQKKDNVKSRSFHEPHVECISKSKAHKLYVLRTKVSVIRNGYLPKRQILTGIGSVSVRTPKVRSKEGETLIFRSVLV